MLASLTSRSATSFSIIWALVSAILILSILIWLIITIFFAWNLHLKNNKKRTKYHLEPEQIKHKIIQNKTKLGKMLDFYQQQINTTATELKWLDGQFQQIDETDKKKAHQITIRLARNQLLQQLSVKLDQKQFSQRANNELQKLKLSNLESFTDQKIKWDQEGMKSAVSRVTINEWTFNHFAGKNRVYWDYFKQVCDVDCSIKPLKDQLEITFSSWSLLKRLQAKNLFNKLIAQSSSVKMSEKLINNALQLVQDNLALQASESGNKLLKEFELSCTNTQLVQLLGFQQFYFGTNLLSLLDLSRSIAVLVRFLNEHCKWELNERLLVETALFNNLQWVNNNDFFLKSHNDLKQLHLSAEQLAIIEQQNRPFYIDAYALLIAGVKQMLMEHDAVEPKEIHFHNAKKVMESFQLFGIDQLALIEYNNCLYGFVTTKLYEIKQLDDLALFKVLFKSFLNKHLKQKFATISLFVNTQTLMI